MTTTSYKIGELIENRYRVREAIETGGMATLYRVADEAKDHDVLALKAVRLDLPPDEIAPRIESFKREFQLLTQIRHPNLVSVYDYGVTAQGELYFTMEWLEGKNLEPKSSRSPLAPQEIIPAVVQICRALNYLHARGVAHGDLKPSNIFLVNGQVKLIDFGVSIEFRNSETRGAYYTPFYSAPEVRERRVMDHRADLYSLGAVWYALLKSEPPLFMRGDERLIQITLEDLLETTPEIPRETAFIVRRLLSPAPNDRYQSANEVIDAINAMSERAYDLETRETAGSYALRANFTGRETELETLKAAWASVQSRDGGIVLINGASGVGKTRLTEEFVIHAQMEGAHVVSGRCLGSDSLAYRPWREILRVLIRYVEAEHEERIKQATTILSLILPELRERAYLKDMTIPIELTPLSAQLRLNDAAIRILREAASLRPTLIVIEDVHWADDPTLSLLSMLTRVQGMESLLICATYQDHEIGEGHPLAAMKGERVQRIALNPLQAETAKNLVASMLGMEALPRLLIQRVQQVSGGNPFFVQELIREMAENGVVLKRAIEGWSIDQRALQDAQLPESIHQVVERRLERLSSETRQVLNLAAVIGPVFWDDAIYELGHLPRERVRSAIQESLRSGLISEQERSAFESTREYIFVNPTVREVNYENMDADLRREAHLQIADWLIVQSGSRDDEHLGLIGGHLERGKDDARAAVYLRRAGEQAASQFANDSALDYFERALALLAENDTAERYDLLLKRWNVHDVQGNRDAQKRDMDVLRSLARSMNDNQRQLELLLLHANFSVLVADFVAAIATAQEALQLARELNDDISQAKAYHAWGTALEFHEEHEAAREICLKALELGKDDLALQANVLRILGLISGNLNDEVNRLAYAEQSLALCRQIGERRGELRALNNLGAFYGSHGYLAKSMEYFQQGVDLARKMEDKYVLTILVANLGDAETITGNYTSAEAHFIEAHTAVLEIGDRRMEVDAVLHFAELALATEDFLRACDYARQVKMKSVEMGLTSRTAFSSTILGNALSEVGRLDEAVKAFEESISMLSKTEQHGEALAGWARVNAMQGDRESALKRIEDVLILLNKNKASEDNDEPFRTYWNGYRVLRDTDDARAPQFLEETYRLLQAKAEKVGNEEMKRSFLENVPVNREIVNEYNQVQPKSST